MVKTDHWPSQSLFRVLPAPVAENHRGCSKFRCATNHFDCAVRGALTSRDRTGLTMLTAVTATLILLSIGTLIAHALDAFRPGY
jgi:hypothetical protein